MSMYEVTLEGFTVHNQTWDHIFNVDGKGDEVYIHSDVRLYDQAGSQLVRSEKKSDIFGDTNGFPNRVQAGDASNRGGLVSGNHYPSPPPYVRQGGEVYATRFPLLLYAGELTNQRAVHITPTIWEWDGGTDLFNEWGRTLVENGPAIAGAVINFINATQGTAIASEAIKTSLEAGLPPLYKALNYIIGQAGDRPIGLQEEGGQAVFNGKAIILNDNMAEEIIAKDFGSGVGVLGISYTDSSRLAGNYTLFIKVRQTGKVGLVLNDGTMWRERSSAYVYIMFGGAKFWIPSPEWLFRYGDWSNVNVTPDGALITVPTIPQEGTVLREWSSAPVYVIQGGQKCWITTPQVLERFGGWSAVRVVPDGGTKSIPDGPQIN
jgi:hypothetical protein